MDRPAVSRLRQIAGIALLAVGAGLFVGASCPYLVAIADTFDWIAPWSATCPDAFRIKALLIVVALFGVATIAFGFSRWLPLSVALLFLCGALDNISVVIRLTLEQMVVPDAIRGRVSAVHYVFIGMSNELGAAESGLAASLVGTVPAIVGGGAIAVLVVAFVSLRWRALAKMPPLAELGPHADA